MATTNVGAEPRVVSMGVEFTAVACVLASANRMTGSQGILYTDFFYMSYRLSSLFLSSSFNYLPTFGLICFRHSS